MRTAVLSRADVYLIAAALALASPAASAQPYRTARGLYRDCASPASGEAAQSERHRRCSAYLRQVLDAWNLNQAPGVCSRHAGDDLARAYVAYWRQRGLGFLFGEFRAAETSAMEFFDSQTQSCPKPVGGER